MTNKMTKASKNINKTSDKKNIGKPVPPKTTKTKKDILDVLNNFFHKREKVILFIGLSLAFLFSLLLFDLKVSPGGDDSAYISRAYDLVHGFVYPSFQGPLYPLVLSLFVWIAGINLFVLKFFSLICILVALYLFYKTFSGKFPHSVTGISFILLCINSSLLYYSGQTYSEAFYIMLQSLFLYFATKKFIEENKKISIGNYLFLGFLALLLTLTRNVAYAAIIALLGFFILTRKWKSTFMFLGGFTICFALFEIIRRLIWGNTVGGQFYTQASAIRYKNFYNPSMGNEDFTGFLVRFFDNSNSFFSKHILNFVGLRTESTEPNTILMILIWALLIAAIVIGLRKNKSLLLISNYTVAMCMVSFFVLQKDWSQPRMIIPYLPLFLLIFFSTLYYATKTKKLKILLFLVPLVAIILFFTSFQITTSSAKQQKEVLTHNLEGDMFYGLTPDWKNYILMSQWAAANTPKDYFTAVRKPDISFIYSERKFYGVTKVPTITPDSLLNYMKDPLTTYVGIQMNKLITTGLYKNDTFRANIIGFASGKLQFGPDPGDNNIIGFFGFKNNDFSKWEEQLKQAGIYYQPNIHKQVVNISKNSSKFSIFIPDYMLEQLHKSKVKYLLLASLRVHPAMKTENIITTLHNYVYYIQLKYPNLFISKHTIGADEPAELVEILY